MPTKKAAASKAAVVKDVEPEVEEDVPDVEPEAEPVATPDEPVDVGPPPPITPAASPTDRGRVNYERLINDQVAGFFNDPAVRAEATDHLLAGRGIKLVGVNADGSDYSPDDADE